jgi:hypothetical protein
VGEFRPWRSLSLSRPNSLELHESQQDDKLLGRFPRQQPRVKLRIPRRASSSRVLCVVSDALATKQEKKRRAKIYAACKRFTSAKRNCCFPHHFSMFTLPNELNELHSPLNCTHFCNTTHNLCRIQSWERRLGSRLKIYLYPVKQLPMGNLHNNHQF